MRRGVAASAVTLLTAGLLAGCSSPRTPSVSARPAVEGFDDVYSQQVAWGECAPDDGIAEAADAPAAECATISVPLEWNSPDRTDRIEVAVNRVRGTGPTIAGSIVLNPGGPGAGGLDLATSLASNPATATLRESYDLVGFDPRGIGQSSPVVCTDESEIAIVRFAQCVADNEVSHFMGTSSVAKDIDVIRVLVGDDSLNYFGYSYGTMLGATYADLFPDRVGRMVLDSAESAGWADLVHSFDQRRAIDRATDRYVTSCTVELTAGVECAFDSRETLQDTVDRLNDEPLVATSGVRYDGDDLAVLMRALLYQRPAGRAAGLAAISSAVGGNQAAIDRLADGGASSSVGEAGMMVSCQSEPRVPDFVALEAHVRSSGATTQDEVDEQLQEYGLDRASSCAVLPEAGSDISTQFSAPDSAPILVIGLTGDHATPYQYARELVDELGNARLLTLDSDGHAASYGDSSCIDREVDAYFLDGTLPADGKICTRDESVRAVPSVDIAASPTNTPVLMGSGTPKERVEISSVGGGTAPRFTDISESGSWGPVDVDAGCYEVRTVKPGSQSDPVAVCVAIGG